jgi:hypothetical protein
MLRQGYAGLRRYDDVTRNDESVIIFLTNFLKINNFQKSKEMAMKTNYEQTLVYAAAHLVVYANSISDFYAVDLFRNPAMKHRHPRSYPFEHRVAFQFLRVAKKDTYSDNGNNSCVDEGMNPYEALDKKIVARLLDAEQSIPASMTRKFGGNTPDLQQTLQTSLMVVADKLAHKLYGQFKLAGIGVFPVDPSTRLFQPCYVHALERINFKGMAKLIQEVLDSGVNMDEMIFNPYRDNHRIVLEKRNPV